MSEMVIRSQPGPALGPTGKAGTVIRLHPGRSTNGAFLTPHSKAQVPGAGGMHRKLSFQSPSMFMSSRTFRNFGTATPKAQFQTGMVKLPGVQAVNAGGAVRAASEPSP